MSYVSNLSKYDLNVSNLISNPPSNALIIEMYHDSRLKTIVDHGMKYARVWVRKEFSHFYKEKGSNDKWISLTNK